jgi:methylenetetrahydrofolate dehydrogenase (NADP+)/methenyltetrahydrofolate cyclohydrolase
MGFFSVTHEMPGSVSQSELLAMVSQCNNDPAIHGVLVQLPLPGHIDAQAVIEAVAYTKDVDGFHPVNVGRLVLGLKCFVPCTPAGIRELLLRSGNDPAGKHAVVVGRSMIVGKPVANLLLQKRHGANAVVTVAHTGAPDLARYTRDADIVIAAAGRPGTITGSMLRPGCVVIDVGTNRVPDPGAPSGYRIVGDVDFESVAAVAGAVTPVPGGVGPMTIAMLMQNTLRAARGDIYS